MPGPRSPSTDPRPGRWLPPCTRGLSRPGRSPGQHCRREIVGWVAERATTRVRSRGQVHVPVEDRGRGDRHNTSWAANPYRHLHLDVDSPSLRRQRLAGSALGRCTRRHRGDQRQGSRLGRHRPELPGGSLQHAASAWTPRAGGSSSSRRTAGRSARSRRPPKRRSAPPSAMRWERPTTLSSPAHASMWLVPTPQSATSGAPTPPRATRRIRW